MKLRDTDMVYMKLMVLKYDKKIKYYKISNRKKYAEVILISGERKRWSFDYIIINF